MELEKEIKCIVVCVDFILRFCVCFSCLFVCVEASHDEKYSFCTFLLGTKKNLSLMSS